MEKQIELSAVTVTPNGIGAIARTLAALRAQTARDRIEVVVVAPREIDANSEELAAFAATQIVAIGPIRSLGGAIAEGARAARGRIVAYSEEHSQPEPRWAETLIERHRGPWAAVGWAVANGNPATAKSWAHLLTDFGPAIPPFRSGERTHPLPWHHVSYKREELLAYDDRLDEMLETEGVLQDDLLRRGRRLYAEGSVASHHLNISLLRFNLRSHLLGGRGYGASRSRNGGWSLPKRIAYALACPLVPAIRLVRLRPDVRRTRAVRGRRAGLIPILVVNLAANALGEALGYVWGEGSVRERRLSMELERGRYLNAADAAVMNGTVSPGSPR